MSFEELTQSRDGDEICPAEHQNFIFKVNYYQYKYKKNHYFFIIKDRAECKCILHLVIKLLFLLNNKYDSVHVACHFWVFGPIKNTPPTLLTSGVHFFLLSSVAGKSNTKMYGYLPFF